MLTKDEQLYARALTTLEAVLTSLQAQVVSIGEEIDVSEGKAQTVASQRLAAVGKQVIAIAGELRRIRSVSQRSVARLTPATVMGYLRQIKPEQRAHFARELEQMDRKDSVLS